MIAPAWKPLVVFFVLLVSRPLWAATPPDIDDRTRAIATELRCVVCQNLSVADSPSEMAQQMRAIVREQVQAGKTSDEIKDFFVSKYGEWVLLRPKTTGFSALLWILPYVVLAIGLMMALWFIRRWSTHKRRDNSSTSTNQQSEAAALRQDFQLPELEDETQRAQLLRERGRLRDELNELEFDFESGKLSESDFAALKADIENNGSQVLRQISQLPAESKTKAPQKQPKVSRESSAPSRLKRWQLVSGGLFLMLFGLTLGVMLTQSIRPRQGEGDTMTGGFMTGTAAPTGALGAALAEGKQAFERQDFPKAIDGFKKALAADPNHPEAHSYMGLILMQAGHGDGALQAFEKALSQAPNFPMALWGKGMVLYQDKKDFAAARAIFERLLAMIPPGDERNEITKLLAEIPTTGGVSQTSKQSPAGESSQSISGTITIDAKLRGNVDPNAALFIIARRADAPAGPPLAVKKIATPTFPIKYSLGQENVMMQGTPFSGKINITARLDKDGNPTTRGTGDLSGEYRRNPAAVGSKNADIVLDQLMP